MERVRKKTDSPLEKGPLPISEDVQGVTDHPITKVATIPPALLTELDKGLIVWDTPRDPENPTVLSHAKANHKHGAHLMPNIHQPSWLIYLCARYRLTLKDPGLQTNKSNQIEPPI